MVIWFIAWYRLAKIFYFHYINTTNKANIIQHYEELTKKILLVIKPLHCFDA
jgi:hypothetical protein